MYANGLELTLDKHHVRKLLERLRAHRLAKNWTQLEMARRSGVSLNTYQNLENGLGNPSLENLVKVVGTLGFAHRIAELIPEVAPPKTLQDVHRAAGTFRLRARKMKPKAAQ
jgi:transcriptional regulator with XRE-family HTH domain